MADVLGVFAKWPEPGRVKTRLAADTSPEWAARVAAAFLGDTLDLAASAPARRVLAVSPPEAVGAFRGQAGGRFEVVPQTAGDLGARMAAFFADRFAEGAGRVVLIGTDSPHLPADFLRRAFAELETADLVLGPAADGGYTLIGMRRPLPVFDGVAWSGPTVLAETVDRLTDPAWRLALLPVWFDVDTPADWQALAGWVRAAERAGGLTGLTRTRRLIGEGPD